MPAALELVPGSLGFPALGVKHTTGPAFFSPICSKVPCCLAREALQGARGLKLSAIPSHTLQPPQTSTCSARGPQESSDPLVVRVELRELRRVTVLGGSALLPWMSPSCPGSDLT